MTRTARILALGSLLLISACATPSSSDKSATDGSTPTSEKTATTVSDGKPQVAIASPGNLDVTCQKPGDVRVLSVMATHKGCKLQYQKHGKKEIVANSDVSADHCNHTQEKIRKRLENSGYSCGK